jgi:hypothetical protein
MPVRRGRVVRGTRHGRRVRITKRNMRDKKSIARTIRILAAGVERGEILSSSVPGTDYWQEQTFETLASALEHGEKLHWCTMTPNSPELQTCCRAWHDNFNKIDRAIIEYNIRKESPKCDPPHFKVCPWCESKTPGKRTVATPTLIQTMHSLEGTNLASCQYCGKKIEKVGDGWLHSDTANKHCERAVPEQEKTHATPERRESVCVHCIKRIVEIGNAWMHLEEGERIHNAKSKCAKIVAEQQTTYATPPAGTPPRAKTLATPSEPRGSDSGPICRHCGLPVSYQEDDRSKWVHTHGFTSCAEGSATDAEPLVAASKTCRHCGKPIKSIGSAGWIHVAQDPYKVNHIFCHATGTNSKRAEP